VQLIREAGLGGRVIIQSFYYPSLIRLKALAPALPTAALRSARDPAPDPVAVVRAAQADIYSPSSQLATREAVDALHRAGIPVVVWTVNDPVEMERLLGVGIGALRGDGIITDYPDRLIQFLRARGVRR